MSIINSWKAAPLLVKLAVIWLIPIIASFIYGVIKVSLVNPELMIFAALVVITALAIVILLLHTARLVDDWN